MLDVFTAAADFAWIGDYNTLKRNCHFFSLYIWKKMSQIKID